MKPVRTRDGRLIADQLRPCGHAQSKHGRRLAERSETLLGAPRPGPRLAGEGPCRRFSFKVFVCQEDEK